MSAPLRVVSLLASATEILYELGLGDQVVGVSHECDFPADARSKPRLTRSHVDAAGTSDQIDRQVKDFFATGQPLYERDQRRLGELAPDLIVTQAQCDVCAIQYDEVMRLVGSLEALRRTQVVALSPHALSDVFADILRVGRAAGRLATAESCVERLEARVRRVRQATADLSGSQRPRVVCVEWVEPLMIAANWTPQLVEFAGGENGLSRAGGHSEYFAWRDVLDYDPEVLLLMPCGFDLSRALREVAVLPNHEGWRDLSAVRAGRVFAVDGNAYFNRSGPRLVESLEILAHLFHPERFAAPLAIPDPNRVWSVFSP